MMREQDVFLIVSPKGRGPGDLNVRVTTRAGKLAADEVAMQLNIRVPDAMFKRPAIRAEVRVPPEAVNRPTITAEVKDNIQAELQRTLGVDLTIAVVETEA